MIVSYTCEGLNDEACGELRTELSGIARENEMWKLIVVPRPGLKARIALTAWTRIALLEELDTTEIERFIRAWRDRGPEHTDH